MSNISTIRRPSDLDNLRKADSAPRCAHVRVDGSACKAPAMREEKYCHIHNFHHKRDLRVLDLPPLEDGNAIQIVLSQVIANILDQSIDRERASLAIWALQVASANLSKTTMQPDLQLDRALSLLEARSERDERLLRLRAELIEARQRRNIEHRAVAAAAQQKKADAAAQAEQSDDYDPEYEKLMRRLEWCASEDWDGTTDPPAEWTPRPLSPEEDAEISAHLDRVLGPDPAPRKRPTAAAPSTDSAPTATSPSAPAPAEPVPPSRKAPSTVGIPQLMTHDPRPPAAGPAT